MKQFILGIFENNLLSFFVLTVIGATQLNLKKYSFKVHDTYNYLAAICTYYDKLTSQLSHKI